MERYLLAFALLGGGSFSFMGAMKNWERFREHRKARFIAGLFGDTGARVFYGGFGLLLCAVGLAILAFGVPQN